MTALPPIIHAAGIALFVFVCIAAAIDLVGQLRRRIVPYSKGEEQ